MAACALPPPGCAEAVWETSGKPFSARHSPEEDAMWKGKTFTRVTAGIFVAAAAACAGGDEAGTAADGDAAVPGAAPPSAGAPGTPAPGGDPTAAPTTGATTPAPAAGGAAAGGDNAALAAQGQQAYAGSVCVSCHGPNAQGTPLAPALNDNEWLWVDPAGDLPTQIATIIKNGVPQPKDPAHVAPMLPYGGVPIDDAQVNALAAYIASLSGG
jgi:mono/diheme cytochrome c family protein